MKLMKLKDISLSITDGDWIESKDQSDSGIRLIQTGNIGEGLYIDKKNRAKYITEETFERLKCSEVVEGDVLISRLPSPVGRSCVIPKLSDKTITAVDCTILRLNPNRCLPKYFVYYSKSKLYQNQVDKHLVGTTRLRISRKNLESINVPIKDIEKQKEIIRVLDKVQALINKRKEQIESCDELVKSQFIEMFGDPRSNPYNWEQSCIGECYDVKGGKRIPKGMGYSDAVTAHPYLRATDMKNTTIIDDDIRYISDEVYNKIKNYTVSGGDIYLTNVGVNLGMAGVIPDKYEGANLTENAVKLVPKQEKLTGMFIAYYINSPGIQEYVNERKMSVGVPKLAIFRIESMPLIIPPLELQNKFGDFVKHTNKLKEQMQQSLVQLEDNFNALMQRAFKGELF